MNTNQLPSQVQVKILPVQQSDLNAVLEILVENNLETWSYKDFSDEILRNDSVFLAAKIESQTVGFCVARLIISEVYQLCTITNFADTKSECEIYNIAVRIGYSAQGIGTEILNKIIQIAQMYKTQEVWLEVRNSNRNAIKFYEKNNFAKMYERKNFYSNPIENAIVMKRVL